MSRALVSLAEKGLRAEIDANENLKAAYRRVMDEREPSRKDEAGKDLIRAIFGKDATAEDTVLRPSARGLATPAGARSGALDHARRSHSLAGMGEIGTASA